MQTIDPNQSNVALRYRTILVLWFAITMSVFMFLVLIYLSPVAIAENQNLSLILNCLGVVPLGISFRMKQKILSRSIDEQRLDLVQVAYVMAFALCEVLALLALMDHFLTGSSYFYVGFVFAGLGMLLHFPGKKYLLAASNQEF